MLVRRKTHVVWITTSVLLALAMYTAYYLAANSILDGQTDGVSPSQQPVFPVYIIVWGFIGSATYVLKTFGEYIGRNDFKEEYIPYHIIRLFIGPSLAVAVYFILLTGGFFGFSIDPTKVPPEVRQYVYAAIAFMTGYFVRPIIQTISNIVNAIFRIEQISK